MLGAGPGCKTRHRILFSSPPRTIFRRSCSARSALALPICLCVIYWLRRVRGRTARIDVSAASTSEASLVAPSPAPDSSFSLIDLRGERCPREVIEAGRDAWVRPWQAALVYAIAGAVFAALLAIAWTFERGDSRLPLSRIALLLWTFQWPAVIAVNLVAGTTPSMRRGVVAAYFAVFAGIAAFGLARNPNLPWREIARFWLLVDGVPTALLALFLARPLRAAGPLVFALLLAAAATAPFAIGDDAEFGVRLAVAALVAVALGWPLLRVIGARYARRRTSDQSLLVASIWLTFGAVYALAPGGADRVRIASSAAAFAGYLLAARVGHDVARQLRRRGEPKRLLLLRVATTLPSSDPLFEALTRHWLHVGGVARLEDRSVPQTRDLLAALDGRHAQADSRRDRQPGSRWTLPRRGVPGLRRRSLAGAARGGGAM